MLLMVSDLNRPKNKINPDQDTIHLGVTQNLMQECGGVYDKPELGDVDGEMSPSNQVIDGRKSAYYDSSDVSELGWSASEGEEDHS